MIPSSFNRLDYPSLRQSVYLNQASLGLIGQSAVTAMHTFIDDVARHGNLYMSDSDEVGYCETLRERAARLLHCDSAQVAIVAGASEILGQLPWLLRSLSDPAASPHIISLGHPHESVQAVVESLRGLNIVCGIRGGRIRISLALYNDASDVNALIEAFARA